MGRKYSGRRPEDKPMFVRPDELDFEKRRMFVPIASGSPTPHPSLIGGRAITYLVAALDAPAHIRSCADYVCDGTDDHVQIQAAIDALPATGGKVVLSSGTFNCEVQIDLDTNQTLQGCGRNTILTTATADLVFLSAVGGDGTELTGIVIADLQIDGADIGDCGIYWEYVDYSLIQNVYLRRFPEGEGDYLCGIYLALSDFNWIDNNDCQGNYIGINLDYSDNNKLSGNTCQGSDEVGIALGNSNGNAVTGNICQGNGVGIALGESNNNAVTGNTCVENSQETDNTYDNIYLLSSDYNNIQGNTCRAGALANKPRYGINISNADCNENKVINNDLYDDGFGTGAYNDSGTDTIYLEPADTEAAVAQAHDRQHAMTSTDDHTSEATENQILKANSDGLPVDATNTDAEVADAVSKKHTQGTDTALGSQAEDLDMNTHQIHNVVDPDEDQDAATKKYVDDNAGGIEDIDDFLENPPTEDEAHKAPTSEYMFDHNAAAIGVHGAGANTLLHSGSVDVIGGAQLTQAFGASSARLSNLILTPKSGYILRISNADASPFAAVINGNPTATSVVYDGETDENHLKNLLTYDGDMYWGRIVLYNTTRSNERLIEAINIGTNTITTTSSTDDWADDDVITTLCQTVGEQWFFTIDLSTKIAATEVGMIIDVFLSDNEGANDINRYIQFHPYEAYNPGKVRNVAATIANDLGIGEITIPVISQRLSMRILAGCEDVLILIRVCGTYEYADT